jgi:hypothetical protein
VRLPAPRFVTFRLKDCDKTTRNISPFYIQKKALDCVAGRVTSASRLKNETLVVEAQAEVLLKAKFLGSHPVHAERHTSLNSSRGVIHTNSLDWYVGRRDSVCPW